ncbi:Glycosyl transferase [uncultured spirochete]|uniref:Glycosyl transferase n=1 Tax=uncultured spirochete TaxID=156406 RepID=A0A3P3XGL2_9SPIR|nr:Glycosyl transferase [uncultured spirochete]
MNTNNPALSIIIPYYNSKEFIEELLSSIPRNKQNEIEVIIVDDKSDNDHVLYLEKLILKYNNYLNINLYFNKGVKSAGTCRNIGLDFAKGKWVLFADADDYFKKDFYIIVSRYFQSDYDIIFFTPDSFNIRTRKRGIRHISYENLIWEYLKNPNKENTLKLKYYFRTPTSKMIKMKVITDNKIRFDEVIVCNDDMFSVKLGKTIKKICATKESIYIITEMDNTLSKRRGKNYYLAFLDVNIRVYDYLKRNLLENEFKILGYDSIAINILIIAYRIYKINIYLLIYTLKRLKENNIPLFKPIVQKIKKYFFRALPQ